MAELSDSIRQLKGIGETRAQAFAKLGIETLGDLLRHFPRSYEDRRALYGIADAPIGESVCVCALVATPPTVSRIRKGLELVKLRVVDGSGSMDVTFFGQTYLKNNLHAGESYVFFGRVEGAGRRKQMTNPAWEAEGQQLSTGCILPRYASTAGISQSLLRQSMRQALDACADKLPELLPSTVQEKFQLCSASVAYESIHFPMEDEALSQARRRLVFEELFCLSLGLTALRETRRIAEGYRLPPVDITPFVQALPFPLTQAQTRCIAQALQDMQSGRPMNRLCQGDVGSGKTMVAAGCIYATAKSGLQSALMAPTELLAQQHFQTLAPLLQRFGIRTALLTGSSSVAQRRVLLAELQSGALDLLIGTHALLTDRVQYHRLGLVVTDEQHRFGVQQRAQLAEKGEHPHLLVMSATPIPRTLALILYGDLDISILDELPPGRQSIDTFLVTESYRPRLWNFVRQQIAEGHQVYLICSLVEASEEDGTQQERKAVTQYAQTLQNEVFPDLRIGYLHGRMKAQEKSAVMGAFAKGEVDILVSTTVVEVGVDVPNATLILIENAERFGLSQLHQLRGRVGRGKAKSYCILLSDQQNPQTRERLTVMTRSSDGFFIAEEDLRLRGPGDFFGDRQHGVPTLHLADLACNTETLVEAQSAVQELLSQDPTLDAHPLLRQQVAQLFARHESTLN